MEGAKKKRRSKKNGVDLAGWAKILTISLGLVTALADFVKVVISVFR